MKTNDLGSANNPVRSAPSIEEVKAQMYDLLIQQEDVEAACRYMADAVKDRRGDRTEKDRDRDTLKRIEHQNRDRFFRIQSQLKEYFGLDMEQIVEDHYREEEFPNATSSISHFHHTHTEETSVNAAEPSVDEEDAHFLAVFLDKLIKFDGGLIDHLKELRRDRPRYFEHANSVYQRLAHRTLDEVIDASSDSDNEETPEKAAERITVNYIVNSVGLVIKENGNESEIGEKAQRKRITLQRLGVSIEGNTRIVIEQYDPDFEEDISINYTVSEAIEINEYNALKWARIHERGEVKPYVENLGQYAEIG